MKIFNLHLIPPFHELYRVRILDNLALAGVIMFPTLIAKRVMGG